MLKPFLQYLFDWWQWPDVSEIPSTSSLHLTWDNGRIKGPSLLQGGTQAGTSNRKKQRLVLRKQTHEKEEQVNTLVHKVIVFGTRGTLRGVVINIYLWKKTKKYRIQETPTLSTDADCMTDTIFKRGVNFYFYRGLGGRQICKMSQPSQPAVV